MSFPSVYHLRASHFRTTTLPRHHLLPSSISIFISFALIPICHPHLPSPLPQQTNKPSCSLNQWALDLPGNRDRIIRSIVLAKAAGATLRVGPELEITGYGCLDHFLELDLYEQCWEVLVEIMGREECGGILCDVGMPIVHRGI